MDPLETYENPCISCTFASRRWPDTQIATFDVRSLDPLETYDNLYISYRGVLKTRWHARVQGGFEGYVRDIWRKFGGHLGVFEATRRLPRGKIKNSFTVLFLS